MAFRRDLFAALSIVAAILTAALLVFLVSMGSRPELTPIPAATLVTIAGIGGAISLAFGLLSWRNAAGLRRARWERRMLVAMKHNKQE